jgi:hypothetical protein
VEDVKFKADDLQAEGRQFIDDVLRAANADRPPHARDLTVEDLCRWLPALVELVSTPEVDPGVRNVVRRLRGYLREE